MENTKDVTRYNFCLLQQKYTGRKSKKTRLLKTYLIGAKFSVTAIDGILLENDKLPDEKRVTGKYFIVFDYENSGNLKEMLMKLGEMYGQDCITYSNASSGEYFVIGTSKRINNALRYEEEKKLDKPMLGKMVNCIQSLKADHLRLV